MYRITIERDYLRAELFGGSTIGEMREFLLAATEAALGHRRERILISIHSSRPIFRIEEYGLCRCFKRLAASAKFRAALLGDSEELRLSHQYAELLAQRRGARFRSFQDEAAALQWLKSAP